MHLNDLDYPLPQELIAQVPRFPKRVMLVQDQAVSEINLLGLKGLFKRGDILVCNNTRVIKCRIFSVDQIEILFLTAQDAFHWEVLFPAKKYKLGSQVQLPGGMTMELVQKGRPQLVKTSGPLTAEYFERYGEVPLPPYIQQARGERHSQKEDEKWYQTAWASELGSMAAPTASLHFSEQDLSDLRIQGVTILFLTLHVGLATFLPMTEDNLENHRMHREWVSIPQDVWQQILKAKAEGHRIWALGTTVTRALESMPRNYFELRNAYYSGETDIFIKPPFTFQVVDCLLTNFHLPKSTLLALVAAFANLSTVHKAYEWATQQKFQFFSYGDLSVWLQK